MAVHTLNTPVAPAGTAGKGKQALWLALGLLVLALLGYGVSRIELGSGPGKAKQQTVKIMLPDTPPPPPPKQEEKRPEPKPDAKPQPQQEAKPQPTPAEPQTLKMEGAAGNGPSAFSSGSVSSDYKGGAVGTGQGGPGLSAEDRRKAQFYANNIRRQLKEELERHLDTEARELVVTFAIWISPDGRLAKFELTPSGDARADADARRAFDEAAKTMRLERPGDVVQPLRLRLTLLPPGQ